MNDVKYLCEQLLDSPPPMRDGAEMLTAVHRSTARRSAIRAGGGLLATAALTGTAVLVAPILTGHPAPSVRVVASPPANLPTSAPTPAPQAPYAQAAGTHDKKMFAAIKRALPAGYTAKSQYPFSTSRTPYPADPAAPLGKGEGAVLSASVDLLVSKDGRVGWVAANIVNDGKSMPTGDLCGPGTALRNSDQPGTTCKTITVNGTSIRVTREHWDNTAPEIDVITATRFLRHGALMITESRSVPDFESEKAQLPPDAVNRHPKKQTPTSALGDWFLTDDQLAALVADPAMLP